MADSNEAKTEDKPAEKLKVELKAVKTAVDTLPTGRLKLTEHVMRQFFVSVPNDTKLEDVLKPPYWRMETRRLEIGSHMYIEPDDGRWFAWVKVIDVDKSGAKLAKLLYTELAGFDSSEVIPGYSITHSGAVKRWVVVTNGEEMKTGLATKAAAQVWAAEHASRMS